MSELLDRIYDDLVARHGGTEALSIADKAVVRRAAALLASDDLSAADTQTIVALTSMLPAPPIPAERTPKVALEFVAAWNLDRLDDHQIGELFHLTQIATGRPIMNSAGTLTMPALPAEVPAATVAALWREVEHLRALLDDAGSPMQVEDAPAVAATNNMGFGNLAESHKAAPAEPSALFGNGRLAENEQTNAPASNVTPLRRPTPQEMAEKAEREAPIVAGGNRYAFLGDVEGNGVDTGASRFDNRG